MKSRLQMAQEKRSAYTRERRRRWLHNKRRGITARLAGGRVVKARTPKLRMTTTIGPGKPKREGLMRRFINRLVK